jgi:hypothetical protein
MGLDTNGVRFLLEARASGVRFSECAMLGRQEMQLSKNQLGSIFKKLSVEFDVSAPEKLLQKNEGDNAVYAESFLRYCGAETVTSIDYSEYEGASLVHDMNTEIPQDLHNKFTCLIDGGTLEHIFNFPVAILNCMKMVKLNGHFLSITPCNNFMGHGFYQFSPELFWGVFSERHGFKVERMYVFESRPFALWYSVADPKSVQSRITLRNREETYLLVQTRKIADLDLKAIHPQQSDYMYAWQSASREVAEAGTESRTFRKIKAFLPEGLKLFLWNAINDTKKAFRATFPEPFYKKYK